MHAFIHSLFIQLLIMPKQSSCTT